MNARGVPLTDFENEKARLEINQPQEKIDFLKEYINQNPGHDRKSLMGKINTEYANLFFDILFGDDNEEDIGTKLDAGMMNIFNDFFFTNYFSALYREKSSNVKKGVNEIRGVTGKAFSDFIEHKWKEHYKGKAEVAIKEALTESIFNYYAVMDCMLKLKNTDVLCCETKIGYDYREDIKDSVNSPSLGAMLRRSAVYDFIVKYKNQLDKEDPEICKMFRYWSRFIYKIDNWSWAGLQEAIQSVNIFRDILEGINRNDIKSLKASIIKTWKDNQNDSQKKVVQGPPWYYWNREVEKVEIGLDDELWDAKIKDAEEELNDIKGFENGRIEFLIDVSKKNDGTYDAVLFDRAKELVKLAFTNVGSASVKEDLRVKFEQAMLAFKPSGCHLPPMTYSKDARHTKKLMTNEELDYFSVNLDHLNKPDDKTKYEPYEMTEEYKYAVEWLKELLDRMKDDITETKLKQVLETFTKEYDGNTAPNQWKWKKAFIEHKELLTESGNRLDQDIINRFVFSFKSSGYEPNALQGDKGDYYTAVYPNSGKRKGYSAELWSFLLFLKLRSEKDGFKYVYNTKEWNITNYMDGDFPNRYFQVLDDTDNELFKVGYINGIFYKKECSAAPEPLGNMEEAKQYIRDEIAKLPKSNNSSN